MLQQQNQDHRWQKGKKKKKKKVTLSWYGNKEFIHTLVLLLVERTSQPVCTVVALVWFLFFLMTHNALSWPNYNSHSWAGCQHSQKGELHVAWSICCPAREEWDRSTFRHPLLAKPAFQLCVGIAALLATQMWKPSTFLPSFVFKGVAPFHYGRKERLRSKERIA